MMNLIANQWFLPEMQRGTEKILFQAKALVGAVTINIIQAEKLLCYTHEHRRL